MNGEVFIGINDFNCNFVKKCYEIGLQYYPNSTLRVNEVNDLSFRVGDKMTELGLKDNSEILHYPELLEEAKKVVAASEYLSEIGYSTIKNEDYVRMVNDIKEKQKKLKQVNQ